MHIIFGMVDADHSVSEQKRQGGGLDENVSSVWYFSLVSPDTWTMFYPSEYMGEMR